MSEQPDGKMPRGAIATVVVGLIATVAAALLASDASSSAAELEWQRTAPLPASEAAELPGGGEMRLGDGQILSTRENAGESVLYRVSEVLDIRNGAAAPPVRVRCEIVGSGDAVVASTPDKRAAYPLPSEELTEQSPPEQSVVRFYSKGSDMTRVDIDDAFSAYTNRAGVLADWEEYREGRQGWFWDLPATRAGETVRLGFATVWKATPPFSADVACGYEADGGTVTVSARAAFPVASG